MNWQKLFNKPKDLTVKFFLQRYFGRYINRMLELSIDNKNKKIHALVELKGEENPIGVDIQYDLHINEEEDSVQIKANAVSISKEWIDLIAQNYIDKEFSIQGKDSVQIIKIIKGVGIV